MTIIKAILSIILFISFFNVHPLIAQEEDDEDEIEESENPCTYIDDKKALKLYQSGINRKKYNKQERLHYLKEALDLAPDYIPANFQMGMEIILTARSTGKSYKPALKYLIKVADECPTYHSDVFYYLGKIAYDDGDYDGTVRYWNKFIKFESDDDSKFSRNYSKKIEEARKGYKTAKFLSDSYNNPVPFNPVTVKNVSTEAGEYLPLLSPDQEYLYFTRRNVKRTQVTDGIFQSDKIEYEERFCMADLINDNVFTVGDPLADPFNIEDDVNYGGATISLDNKHIILTVCKKGKFDYVNCDLYATDYKYWYDEEKDEYHGYWTELRNLGDSINTEDGWEAQPSLSSDGKTLYFASAREDSKGIDIYSATQDTGGNWSRAVNIGPPINTEGNDKSPFIHSDSKTLYFASTQTDNRLGFGGYDIYYSKLREDSKWEEPLNIGYPINSSEDEHGFVVSTDGKKVYFASDKIKGSGGGLDIFSFDLYKAARPDKVLFLKGEVRDENGQTVPDAVVEIKNMKTRQLVQIQVDSIDGKYAAVINIHHGEDVLMNVKADKKVFNSHLFSEKDTAKNVFQELNIDLQSLDLNKPYTINDIHYKTNSAEIQEESKLVLDEFIEYLKQYSNIKVEIRGHTDNVGEAENNFVLSSDRAYSVMAYLQEKGISKFRLSFHGFGETMPIASNDTPEGRALNRRTEFVIISE